MNREILLAALAAALTIALMWVGNHPGRVVGTAVTVVVLIVIAAVVRIRSGRPPRRKLQVRNRKP